MLLVSVLFMFLSLMHAFFICNCICHHFLSLFLTYFLFYMFAVTIYCKCDRNVTNRSLSFSVNKIILVTCINLYTCNPASIKFRATIGGPAKLHLDGVSLAGR